MRCMNCNNEQMNLVHKSKIPGWAIVCAIIFFPIGLFFLFARKKYNLFVCDKCGYRMKDEI